MKKYVGKYTLIMPQGLHDNVKKYIEDSEAILKQQPDYYDADMISGIGNVDKFANVEKRWEKTIEELYEWVKAPTNKEDKQDKPKIKNGKPARIQVSKWKSKPTNDKGFILHKFGESELKVWSEEEALQQRGGLSPHSRRIFPCYTDTNDANTLRWYIFYRND